MLLHARLELYTPNCEPYSPFCPQSWLSFRLYRGAADCPSSSKTHLWLDLGSRYRQISHKPWQPRKLRGEISPGATKHTHTHATASASNPFLTSMKTKPRLSGHSICCSSNGWPDTTTGEWNCHTITQKGYFSFNNIFVLKKKKIISLKKRHLWPKKKI